MDLLNVLHHFVFSPEAGSAMLARVLINAGVREHVRFQIGRQFECFRTHIAHKFLFITMHRIHMPFNSTAIEKPRRTYFA